MLLLPALILDVKLKRVPV